MILGTVNHPETMHIQMLPRNHPNCIRIVFHDHHLVTNAGRILPATLTLHLGPQPLDDGHLDLGRAHPRRQDDSPSGLSPGRGDCIDDADALRNGGAPSVLGCVVKAPFIPCTFLRGFGWVHLRQSDRMSRELLARAWPPRTGLGDGLPTIGLDSTVCNRLGCFACPIAISTRDQHQLSSPYFRYWSTVLADTVNGRPISRRLTFPCRSQRARATWSGPSLRGGTGSFPPSVPW